ncbi:unnamed protein product [Strongylus vulgaris]|uniref:Uncharacterized protein n=1 Tax=Strongylus vulgaris TaxID=40348 RepID=A0A3P7K030_STRVU|nr:unnamed protein product [Strongylus vulgaris]
MVIIEPARIHLIAHWKYRSVNISIITCVQDNAFFQSKNKYDKHGL